MYEIIGNLIIPWPLKKQKDYVRTQLKNEALSPGMFAYWLNKQDELTCSHGLHNNKHWIT